MFLSRRGEYRAEVTRPIVDPSAVTGHFESLNEIRSPESSTPTSLRRAD